MTKLIVIYNTSEAAGRENSAYYIAAIESILGQTFKDFKLVISGYRLSPNTKEKLLRKFKGKAAFNFIDDKYPVTVTYNLSCLKALYAFGNADTMYVDSGCQFMGRKDLGTLYSAFESYNGSVGMYSVRVDEDSGFHDWFGLGKHQFDYSEDYKLVENGDFTVPIGKTCNLHGQIFSKELTAYYGKPYVDIFGGHCSESVFSFVCAAVRSKMVVNKDIVMHHERLDKQSHDFDPWKWEQTGKRRSEHPYLIPSVMDIVGSAEARRLGLGYEELQGLVMHDASQYDENGFCKNEELKKYIKDNLYVPKSLLDYNAINCEFIYE